jgi:hypothetical protein
MTPDPYEGMTARDILETVLLNEAGELATLTDGDRPPFGLPLENSEIIDRVERSITRLQAALAAAKARA